MVTGGIGRVAARCGPVATTTNGTASVRTANGSDMMRRSMLWAGIAAAAMMAAGTSVQAQAPAAVTAETADTIRLALKDWLVCKLNSADGALVTTFSGA